MTDIKIPEVQMIARNKLIIDKSNPNVMSDEDYDALKEVIKKFGFIVPIITNKDFLIADGFHRFKAARDLNIDPVPIISLDVDEIDRRLLRQILNKLHGTHKEDLDQEEFKFLDDSGAITELMNYLPNERNVIKKIIDNLKDNNEKVISNDKNKVSQLYKQVVKCPKCGATFEKID